MGTIKMIVVLFQTPRISYEATKCLLRPCVRRKFHNFLFLRFSEKFVYSKFGNCSEISGFFELTKILQKKLGKKFGNNFLFLGQKVRKSLETGFSKHSEFSEFLEIVLFRTFQKLRKNDVKLKLQKSWKTCSNLKTDSKVWLKVWNAGP